MKGIGASRIAAVGAAMLAAAASAANNLNRFYSGQRLVNSTHRTTADSKAGRQMAHAKMGNSHNNVPSFNGPREMERRVRQAQRVKDNAARG